MNPRHSRGGSNTHYRDQNGYKKSPHYRDSLSPSRRISRNEPISHDHGGQDSRHGPPTGPNSARSPPFDPPSGPSNRGPRAGFRGGSFAGRGAHRNPPSRGSQWDLNSSRGGEQRQGSNGENDETTAMDIDSNDLDNKAFDRVRDERGHDRSERSRQDAPKGPSAQTSSPSKFSFAFKPSKAPPSGPKPEISQKFNAPAPKKEIQPKDGKNEPPPGAPTQPLFDRKPPEGPKMAPRMRKVMKKMQRPKPRPTLPPHLVASESVFFRKPGNESVVGSGTYGKVFKGLNVYTKGQVALKRIRMEGERDGFPVTAVREIKLLQSLRHQNIVNLQEVMVEKNDCFMVFEYLSHDLTGLLNHPHFKLEPPQKKHLAKQLFEGLDYLHVRGVLHRDIKAANILVSSDGILKIADFGLARFYAKRHQLDYTNRVITIWYRSPELLLGETQYTAAVDIWSAACVMMEIFVQKPIFAGDGTELSQLDKIYNVLGTPNRYDWPGLVDMAWFELLRPTAKRRSMFAEMFSAELTPAAYELTQSMFLYDPAKRPTAGEVLAHPYFTTEEPLPKQATELANIGGDWHEFESKALRKENERREREARRVAKNPVPTAAPTNHGQERKRGTDGDEGARDAKRVHVEESAPAA
ncbi:CTD kinase subunit alpha [Beauveria bassiana ARSEF 2860]|uniref:cyclin-dependent kinase n=1 Tax=Beauveria bassiana (strain ARSEF 2860) TaxID=655819 RepID=J5JUT5_BEAB2|nr:CTD kinase subunit alpha [Beauveria bassiana ARSEF 2860]EJP68518.1 CTD kinase subunit alpha [Beauveria bassiana ARSEF 2860]